MKKIYTLLLALFVSFFVHAQPYFVSSTDLGITSSAIFNALAGKGIYDVRAYKIIYNTTDIDGSATTASGLLCVPENSNCNNFPLGSYNHGTVLQRESVPSRNNSEAFLVKAVASLGLVTVSPDYLGLGDNPGLHPYLHAESQATATIDLIRAAREFLPDSLSISLNGECFFTGYSQGGHAAMGTVKYIQDNNLDTEFNIVAAGPASGPYNLSGSQSQVFISNQPYSNPGYVCYLLFGLNRVYGNIYNSYSDILKAPYDTLIPPYFDGTYPMDSVNAKLPNRLGDFIQDTVLANFVADSVGKTHPIWQALIKQDNYDWKPNFTLRMYYCTQDEQVSFQNSLGAELAMNANGATSVTAINKGALNHGGCVTPSLFDARDYFTSVATSCQGIGLAERKGLEGIELFPNPAKNNLYLKGFNEQDKVEVQIINLNGAVLLRKQQGANEPISITNLTPGMYLISLNSGVGIKVFKFNKN